MKSLKKKFVVLRIAATLVPFRIISVATTDFSADLEAAEQPCPVANEAGAD
jgi:hypothetical protein